MFGCQHLPDVGALLTRSQLAWEAAYLGVGGLIGVLSLPACRKRRESTWLWVLTWLAFWLPLAFHLFVEVLAAHRRTRGRHPMRQGNAK